MARTKRTTHKSRGAAQQRKHLNSPVIQQEVVPRRINNSNLPEIDNAIANRDWTLVQNRIQVGDDLCCVYCISSLEGLQSIGYSIDYLHQHKAIINLKQLEYLNDHFLMRIDQHPEELIYLRRLNHAWQQLTEDYMANQLPDASILSAINTTAVEKMCNLYISGNLSVNMQQKITNEINVINYNIYQKWKINLTADSDLIHQQIIKTLVALYLDQEYSNILDQLIKNTHELFISNYCTGKSGSELLNGIDQELISKLIRQLSDDSIMLAIKDVIVDIVVKQKILLPEQQMQQLILHWRNNELSSNIATTLESLAREIINQTTFNPLVYQKLREPAAELLIRQLKNNQLEGDVAQSLIKLIQVTLNETIAPEQLQKMACEAIINDWRNNKEKYSLSEREILEDIIIGEWKAQIERLKIYAYPAAMVTEIKQIQEENLELKQQLQSQGEQIIQLQQQVSQMLLSMPCDQQIETNAKSKVDFFNK